MGTTFSPPDFDYTARIEAVDPAADGWTIDDPDGILGVHNEGTTNFAAGKSARLVLPTFEVLDAQAFGPTMGGGIALDPDSDVDESWRRTGVFADGTSALVVRLNAGDAFADKDVVFEVKHTNSAFFPQTSDFVGSLSTAFPALPAPDQGDGLGDMSVTVNGEVDAIVYYRPPNNFLFGRSETEQRLEISVVADGETVASAELLLKRPTIVLNHGFTSNPANMNDMMLGLQAANPLLRVRSLDWSDINTSGYDTVPARVKAEIEDEVEMQRAAGVAATRLDFFGHSMGGVIVKWYASDMGIVNQPRTIPRDDGFLPLVWNGLANAYRRSDNFGIGDIRRFVSVGSPFQGAPLADNVSQLIGWPGILQLIEVVNAQPLGPPLTGDGMAFNDLGLLSRGTLILSNQSPAISWLPIVGVGAPTMTQNDLIPVFLFLFEAINASPAELGLLAGNSDFVVRDLSQVDSAAGLFPPTSLLHSIVLSVTHTNEARNTDVRGILQEALDLKFVFPDEPGYVQGHIRFNTGF